MFWKFRGHVLCRYRSRASVVIHVWELATVDWDQPNSMHLTKLALHSMCLDFIAVVMVFLFSE